MILRILILCRCMKLTASKNTVLSFFCLFFFVLTLCASGNSFFWDTIQLGSKQAHWFYDNNFRHLLLPNRIDSGHPPVFGLYLACLWKIFGRSLAVSHLGMLPFLIGIVFQLHRLVSRFFSRENVLAVMCLVFADPTLLAQSIMVSPDVVLVFFLLLALNSLLEGRRMALMLALTGLGLISMRGMFCIVIVFAVDTVLHFSSPGSFIKNTVPYIPVSLLVLVFLAYHLIHKGWIGYHKDSPWAACFETVDTMGFFKNILILFWRIFDFGRIGLWVAAAYLLLRHRRLYTDGKSRTLFILFLVSFSILSLSLLFYKNLLAHRYLIPVYITFSLWLAYMLLEVQGARKIWIVLLLLLISGNFWVYPEQVAKGWDSSLAHVPYYGLREQMISYIRAEKIPITDISSEFPNVSKLRYTDLNDEESAFCEKDMTCRYIIYSNVFNGFTNEEIRDLQESWILRKEFRKGQVFVRLYEKPDK